MGFWEWLTGNSPVDPPDAGQPQDTGYDEYRHCKDCMWAYFQGLEDGTYRYYCSQGDKFIGDVYVNADYNSIGSEGIYGCDSFAKRY